MKTFLENLCRYKKSNSFHMDFGLSFQCLDTDLNEAEITANFFAKKQSLCNLYFVPPAPESGHGFRQILVRHDPRFIHGDLRMPSSFWHRLNKTEFKLLAVNNFPVDEVTDWTPEEAEEISLAFCPMRLLDV